MLRMFPVPGRSGTVQEHGPDAVVIWAIGSRAPSEEGLHQILTSGCSPRSSGLTQYSIAIVSPAVNDSPACGDMNRAEARTSMGLGATSSRLPARSFARAQSTPFRTPGGGRKVCVRDPAARLRLASENSARSPSFRKRSATAHGSATTRSIGPGTPSSYASRSVSSIRGGVLSIVSFPWPSVVAVGSGPVFPTVSRGRRKIS